MCYTFYSSRIKTKNRRSRLTALSLFFSCGTILQRVLEDDGSLSWNALSWNATDISLLALRQLFSIPSTSPCSDRSHFKMTYFSHYVKPSMSFCSFQFKGLKIFFVILDVRPLWEKQDHNSTDRDQFARKRLQNLFSPSSKSRAYPMRTWFSSRVHAYMKA